MFSMYDINKSKHDEEIDGSLELLVDVGQMVVKQKAEAAEHFTGVDEANIYAIYNPQGKIILKAFSVENDEPRPCTLNAKPPFAVDILSPSHDLIMKARSQETCLSRKINIECPKGYDFAIIEEPFAWLAPSFIVKDASGSLMFKVVSPMAAAFGTFDSAIFTVYSYDEKTKLGAISKDWSGLGMEMFTDTDAFAMNVPDDMDVKWKAVLLTVLFLIDFTFYEQFS